MRIAYVSSDPGIPVFGTKGASIHVQSVVGQLLARGHEVHLVTARPGGDRHAAPAAPPAPAGHPRLTVHALPTVTEREPAVRELALAAADCAVAPLLDALDPDLVYERYSLWGHTAIRWAAARGRCSILEVNAPLVDEQRRHRGLQATGLATSLAQQTLSAAGTVVCVSEQVAGWVRTLTSASQRVCVVPNGVDTRRITVTDRPVAPADAAVFTVGFVGTLKPWHGVEVLLDTVAALHATDPSWRLLVVGAGPMAAELQRSAAARAAGAAVTFAGAVDPGAVAGSLHRMDVACAPYPAPDEPSQHYFSPMKVYEYLAAGLPVVASAVGQLPALLDHGGLGVLVPPGDRAALGRALTALRSDTATRAALRTAGRAAAEQRHTWSGVVEQILDLGVGRVPA